ncbi:DUF4276 family protein [Rufibacter latericius]|uniref:DUF4276 family protein n=1 Tax=Rufibacter latericius TaxID=2487040 RepID=A0A3M9MTK7_9BACT|nr:DUF4276 family protein [Rufibacter latericius]RNI28850.1 DUF4276 family protein [Rufibacter latericius]
MSCKLAFIVEGHSEYDTVQTIISKIIGSCYFPVNNARGIGNIIKNVEKELLLTIKSFKPEKIIIALDYREAQRQGTVNNCIELKELIQEKCNRFIEIQTKNGSLVLPESITVIIVDKTYETWFCADYEGLKMNDLVDETKIIETFSNVDLEIPNPDKWLGEKLKGKIDLKSKNNRKVLTRTMRPEIAKDNSRSFRKFYEEVLRFSF